MQVRVWDSTHFQNWDAAVAALAAGVSIGSTQAGASAVFTYTVGEPADPSSQMMANFSGFQLVAIPTGIPEPKTMALGFLGAVLLVGSLRRDKLSDPLRKGDVVGSN
jgi:hypothetical protein